MKIEMNNKRILITGAAGFIGAGLAKRILSETPSAFVVGIDNVNEMCIRDSGYAVQYGHPDQRAGVYYGGGGQQGEGGSVYEGEEPDCHPAEKPGD